MKSRSFSFSYDAGRAYAEQGVLKMLNHYDGDDTYFNGLVADGKAVTISEGTEVQIIDKKFGMLKVSAPGGTVWIPTSCTK